MDSSPTILETLKTLTKRNSLHERVMLIFMVVLFAFGIALLIFAFIAEQSTERIASIVGSVVFEALILLPYNKVQDLRKQNIVIGMLAAIIDRFQDKVESDTLQDLIKELLEYTLKR